MVFVKVVKNKAYYKRYQTKFRRRREGKTDYQQRQGLIVQDNNKYNTKKYRFVVRITKKKVICQVIYAELRGDYVLCQADSQELKRFGLTAGLTNYPAAYSTGLLLARRLLKSLDMDTMYKGSEEVTGRRYDVSRHQAEKRPFKAVLDVGLARTTTGARVFGALKGACDGGLHIPHHTRRFPGSSKNKKRKKVKYNAEDHKNRIMGEHVQEWTDHIWEAEGEEEYKKRFRNWNQCLDDNKTEMMADIYNKVHAAIRENPERVPNVNNATAPTLKRQENLNQRIFEGAGGKEYRRDRRLTNEERKERVQAKIDIHAQLQAAEKEEEVSEEEEEEEEDDE